MQIHTKNQKKIIQTEMKVDNWEGKTVKSYSEGILTKNSFHPEQFLNRKELKVWNRLSASKQKKILKKANKAAERKLLRENFQKGEDPLKKKVAQENFAVIKRKAAAGMMRNRRIRRQSLTPGQRLAIERYLESEAAAKTAQNLVYGREIEKRGGKKEKHQQQETKAYRGDTAKIKEELSHVEQKNSFKAIQRLYYERRMLDTCRSKMNQLTQGADEREAIEQVRRQLGEESLGIGKFVYHKTQPLSQKAVRAAQNTVRRKIGTSREKLKRTAARMQAAQEAGKAAKGITVVTRGILAAVQILLALLQMVVITLLPLLIPLIVIAVLFAVILTLVMSILSAIFASASNSALSSGFMPYYNQGDYRDYAFNGGSIASDGCGITSFAMVASYLTGTSILPPEIAELANSDSRYNTVTTHSAIGNLADTYELGAVEEMGGPRQNCCNRTDFDLEYIQEKISLNCPIIASHTGGYFATDQSGQPYGHYVAYCGAGANGVFVYDPGSSSKYHESIQTSGTDWNKAFEGAKHIWIFPPGPDLTTLEGANNAERIYNFCNSHGLSAEASAAVVGTIWGETSQGYDDIHIDMTEMGNGEGIGICQWSFGRKTTFLAYAESRGEPWPTTSLGVQLDFFWQELNTDQWLWSSYGPPYGNDCHISLEEFKQLTDIDRAVRTFCANFERGPRREDGLQFRINKAREVYAAYHG